MLRFSFANLTEAEIDELPHRLAELGAEEVGGEVAAAIGQDEAGKLLDHEVDGQGVGAVGAHGARLLAEEGIPLRAASTARGAVVAPGADGLDWDCSGGTLPAEYRPDDCR